MIGTPLNASNVLNSSFEPLLRQAKLLNIRFHDLRHTCVSLLLSKNTNPKAVQELPGHSSITVTMDT
jgi:integrase